MAFDKKKYHREYDKKRYVPRERKPPKNDSYLKYQKIDSSISNEFTEHVDEGYNNKYSPKHRGWDKINTDNRIAPPYPQYIDGMPKENHQRLKQLVDEKINNKMKLLNADWLNSVFDEWENYLFDSLYVNKSSSRVFRKEVPRIAPFSFFSYYKEKFDVVLSKNFLNDALKRYPELQPRMNDINDITEDLFQLYLANGKINSNAGTFLLKNRYKENWRDEKHNVNTSTMNKIVWTESIYQLPLKEQPQQLPNHIDYDEFEDIPPAPESSENDESKID